MSADDQPDPAEPAASDGAAPSAPEATPEATPETTPETTDGHAHHAHHEHHLADLTDLPDFEIGRPLAPAPGPGAPSTHLGAPKRADAGARRKATAGIGWGSRR